MMERMRETSLVDLAVLGLKSQSLVMRSHSVPGSSAAVSATSSFSADRLAWRVLASVSSCAVYHSASSSAAFCRTLHRRIFSGSSRTGTGDRRAGIDSGTASDI